ncbi:uncharacterized protein K02A2.6-like [Cydia splendana]|uniref:uncharacterized protein K02A2.6-like n=1 Tax=Cydia splendana TaxID=1100963 RepID=UPI00300D6CCE
MAKMSVGKMDAFDRNKDNWATYIDRLEQYFIVNDVQDDRKVPLLITAMGADSYDLLVTLCTPTKPSEKTYNELVKLMSSHLQPRPSVLAERYKFRQRKQSKNESIADFIADLQKLTKYCEFGTWLDDSLRDQFVCGLYNETIRMRLFTEKDLKFAKAKGLAIAMEAAEVNAAAVESRGRSSGNDATTPCFSISNDKHSNFKTPLRNTRSYPKSDEQTKVVRNEVNRWRPNGQRPNNSYRGPVTSRSADGNRAQVGQGQGTCSACGGAHAAQTCKFRLYVCRVCNQDGHLKKMCPRLTKVNYVEDEYSEEETYDLEVNLSFVKEDNFSKYKPYYVTLNVNNHDIKMEIDTGSAISCISPKVYEKYFSNCELKPGHLILRYYSGEKVRPLGRLKPLIKYKDRSMPLDLFVIEDGKTNLLGRQWLVELGIIKVSFESDLINYVKTSRDFNLSNFSSRFKSVFSEGLGRYNGGLVSLRVRPDAHPVFLRARPLAYALREPVERELERLERDGVITPVETSEWATPIVPVVKSDGTIRICGDYKISLNKHLDVDRFPLPRVEDLFTKLHGGQKFSKIDLSQAYAQLVLDDTAKYTVINTHKGLFKYNRLIYGLSSSPGIFQRILEQMFADLPKVGVFLDDVVITGENDKEHIGNLYRVFERLEKYGLKIKKDKCSFLANSITYLGYVVDKEGLHTCPKKVRDILNVTTPSNVSELRSFLGMAMYYAKFVRNISTILTPLYELLKKNVKFEWSQSCQEALNKVKRLLASSEVLAHYSPDLPLILTTDASSVGVAAVISHAWPDGTERPIAYASRVLNSAEKAYSQIEREGLAIIYGVKKFHQYLYGRRFILRTDHKPLVTIFGDKAGIPVMAASRMQRWAIILGGYQYDIEYVHTTKNGADALSRLPPHRPDSNQTSEEITYLNFVQNFLPLTSQDVQKATEKNIILRQVLTYIRGGWPASSTSEELKPFFSRRHELYVEGGCVMWGYRMVIPENLRANILKELHSSHQGMVKMKSVARSFVWWPNIDSDIEAMSRNCAICAVEACAPPRVKSQPWPYYSEPWSRLHVDFLGPYEGRTFFILIDSTTKWIEAFLMTRTTAKAVIKVLRETFARFGLPKEVVSDNGPPFTSQEMDEFMRLNGITHTFTAPYHPSSNGAAEGAVKLCKRAIKKAIRENRDIEETLQTFLLNYRNCEQGTTGETPAMLLQKRRLRSRLDQLKPTCAVEKRVHRAQHKQIESAGGILPNQMDEGDPVWVQEFNARDKWVPGTVSKVTGSRNYVVTKENGTTCSRHLDQLKSRYAYCLPSSSPSDSTPQVSPLRASVPPPRSPAAPAPAPPAPAPAPAPLAPHAAPALTLAPAPELKRIRKPPVRFGFEID